MSKNLRTTYKEHLNRIIAKRENRINNLKEIDRILSEVTFDNLNLKNQSTSKKIQKKLDQIEAHLSKIKDNYKKVSSTNEEKAQKILKIFQTELEKSIYKVKVEIAHLKHQNKVTNDKLWWQLLSKEERKERRSDLSFYRPDVMGYWLTLLSVAAEILYLILLLGIMSRTFWIGVSILVNIVFLLFLFTIAIKVKNYKKFFSYASIVFGVYCILRIVWIVPGLMGVDLSTTTSMKRGFIIGCNIYMIVASILVGVLSAIKIKRQEIHIKENKISKIQMSK